MKRQLGFLGGLILLSACEPEIAFEQSEIINGEVAKLGDFPAVGALAFPSGNGFFEYCTGTLIAPNIVLSAAHCVDPALSGVSLAQTAAQTRVVFNRVNLNTAAPQEVIASVSQIFQNENFDINNLNAGNDVSLLILKNPIAGIDPIPFNTTDTTTLVGKLFTAVGFGVSNAANQSGSGTQRFANFTLEDAQGELNFYGQNDTTTGVCFGDSGGPDLIQIGNQTFVFGIHSFVFDGSTCLGGAGAQRTDTQTAFIQPLVDQFKQDPPPLNTVDVTKGCSVEGGASSGATAPLFLLFVASAFALRRRKSS